MYLVINNIIAQKHNSTARTDTMFENSAAETRKVVIVFVTILYLERSLNISYNLSCIQKVNCLQFTWNKINDTHSPFPLLYFDLALNVFDT